MSENTQGMVERVARAIHFRGDDQGDDAWNHCQEWHRTVAREQARAAIEAMREPTEAQTEAAYEAVALDDCWRIEDDRHFAKAYRAAIDAALSPEAKTGEGRE